MRKLASTRGQLAVVLPGRDWANGWSCGHLDLSESLNSWYSVASQSVGAQGGLAFVWVQGPLA